MGIFIQPESRQIVVCLYPQVEFTELGEGECSLNVSMEAHKLVFVQNGLQLRLPMITCGLDGYGEKSWKKGEI